MSRAEHRRADRARAKGVVPIHERTYPMSVGVLPDGSKEAIAQAMVEAHEILEPMPGTQVQVVTYPDREHGLKVVDGAFGPEAVAHIRRLLDERGPSSVITVCMRSTPEMRADAEHHRQHTHTNDCEHP